MPTINQLSSTTTLTASDKMVVYSQDNGDSRKATLSTLLSFLHDNFQEEGLVTQVVVPTTGQNVTVNAQTQDLWLVLNPAGVLASLTVTMPPKASAFDGQQVSISTSQALTSLTIGGNGATVYGEPGTLPAGGFLTMKYSVNQDGWYATSPSASNSFGTIKVTTSINDSSNNEIVRIGSAASAVNEVTITNAATGGDPSISATGGDTDIDLNLLGKGAGTVKVNGVDVVTTTGTQTLTNKTLTSPTLTSVTLVGTTSLGATTLTGNVTPSVTETHSIGTGLTSRINKLWTKDIDANGTIGASDVRSLQMNSGLFIGYDTVANPPSGSVGAVTQRNAVVASCRYLTSTGLSTKRYNVSTISESGAFGGNYTVTLHDAISTDSAVVVTLGNNGVTTGKFFIVGAVTVVSSTQIAVDTYEVDLAANTTTAKSANFSLVVIGGPDVDRTLL